MGIDYRSIDQSSGAQFAPAHPEMGPAEPAQASSAEFAAFRRRGPIRPGILRPGTEYPGLRTLVIGVDDCGKPRESCAMRDYWSSFFLLILLCASVGAGLFVNSRLPERHRSRDSIELVQLAITLLVTFTAIVLGLLTTSVKSGFDAAYSARGAYAGQLAQLDRCLRDYGPEAQPMREQLRSYVAAVIASTWPSEPLPTGTPYPDVTHMPRTGESSVLAALMDRIGIEIGSLQPTDMLHHNLMAACTEQYAEVIRRRWTVIEGIHGSISAPFYWVLVLWLVIMFGSFGLLAPPNPLSVIVMGLCAVCVTTAVFVILDMDVPYGGLFGIPSTSMREALADMLRTNP
jgi:hypothetical protein